jgi:hypothetical protein
MSVRKNLLSLIAGFSLLAFGSGCVHYSMSKHPRAAEPLPVDVKVDMWQNYYRKADASESERKLIANKNKYSIERIVLPESSTAEGIHYREIVFDLYTPKSKDDEKKFPAIQIMPIMGGKSYPVEHYFASHLKGYVSAIPHRENIKREIKGLGDVDNLLKESVVDSRRIFDWLERQDNIDTNKFGVLGISFGAIKASLILPQESRIKAAVLGLVGGDLPYILAQTREKSLGKYRDGLLKRQRLTLEQGEEILRQDITYDPIRFAPYVNTEEVYMVLACADTVVPYKKGIELWRAMGKPRLDVYPGNHRGVLPFISIIKARTKGFFNKKFKEAELEVANKNGR